MLQACFELLRRHAKLTFDQILWLHDRDEVALDWCSSSTFILRVSCTARAQLGKQSVQGVCERICHRYCTCLLVPLLLAQHAWYVCVHLKIALADGVHCKSWGGRFGKHNGIVEVEYARSDC